MSSQGIESRFIYGTTALTIEQHRLLVKEYNDSASPFPHDRTVVDLFDEQATRTPSAPAIRHGSRSLCFEETHTLASRVGTHLKTLGIGPGKVVLLRMEHSPEMICALLGILKAGAAYVPIDPATPPRRLASVCQAISGGLNGELPTLVTQPNLRDGLPTELGRVITFGHGLEEVSRQSSGNPEPQPGPHDLAYIIYTSGSTGTPKGVAVEHISLLNYVFWAIRTYCGHETLTWPLFSSIAFDLTVTSIFTPLLSGGCIRVMGGDPRTAVIRVIEDGDVDIVKLTPAHLAMIRDGNLSATGIRRIIVGGEDFRTQLAQGITQGFGRPVELFNEYGPTEATVGCMVHRFDGASDVGASVPIGVPAANTCIFLLDEKHDPVPPGETGEIFVSGVGLARGYFNEPGLTEERFPLIDDPRQKHATQRADQSSSRLRVYRTGDLARWNSRGQLEFLGRNDHQVKIHGARIELGEIEARLLQHPQVRECVVVSSKKQQERATRDVQHCERCGVPSNLPGSTFDEEGICNLCRSYDTYKERAEAYFKSPDDLREIIAQVKATRTGQYDCLVLVSGGKDSSYMLYKLCDMGLTPLVFSLDNGYISDDAKTNIHNMTRSLGVDLIFQGTPHMNDIFVDSLNTFANVCNGCFKTIYTLATSIALDRGIRHIFTGLSRGQFFETRLTEEVFQRADFDASRLDELVLEARKAYHMRDDAVSAHLAVDILRGDGVLDDIQFIDFYRYVSVSLDEIYSYLTSRGAWTRPTDTGRSTNCLINDLGIYIHKKQRGFHNYALPYSWDVRLGQKTREQAMEELQDDIDEARVKRMMVEIGYQEPPSNEGMDRLVAYYVSDAPLDAAEMRSYLAQELPDYMLPHHYLSLDRLPLTENGKVDRAALPQPASDSIGALEEGNEPQTPVERALASIFRELLNRDRVGVNDDFFDLGGHSLLGIRAISRIRDTLGVDLPLTAIFDRPTIAELSAGLPEMGALPDTVDRIVGRPETSIPRQARQPLRQPSGGA